MFECVLEGPRFLKMVSVETGSLSKWSKKKKGCILLPSKKSVDLAFSQVKSIIYSTSTGKLALPNFPNYQVILTI